MYRLFKPRKDNVTVYTSGLDRIVKSIEDRNINTVLEWYTTNIILLDNGHWLKKIIRTLIVNPNLDIIDYIKFVDAKLHQADRTFNIGSIYSRPNIKEGIIGNECIAIEYDFNNDLFNIEDYEDIKFIETIYTNTTDLMFNFKEWGTSVYLIDFKAMMVWVKLILNKQKISLDRIITLICKEIIKSTYKVNRINRDIEYLKYGNADKVDGKHLYYLIDIYKYVDKQMEHRSSIKGTSSVTVIKNLGIESILSNISRISTSRQLLPILLPLSKYWYNSIDSISKMEDYYKSDKLLMDKVFNISDRDNLLL